MGVIARQSVKAAIVTYISVIVGVLNQILIYPLFLSVKEYGEIQFILQTSVFFTPFILVGVTTLLTKYYPIYAQNNDQKRLLYGLIFIPIFINTGLFLITFFVFRHEINEYISLDSKAQSISILALFIISALHPWQILCNNICAIKGRISFPSLLNQSVKIALPIIVVLYFYKWISFTNLIEILCVFYISVTLGLGYYTSQLERVAPIISLKKFKSSFNLKKMMVFAGFSMFTSVGVTLTNQIDVVMVTTICGTYYTGLYSWALFCATAIAIPYGIIASISTPIISSYWKNNQLKEINKIYKSSSSTLLILSLLFFLSFWLVIDDLFSIMPKGIEYKNAKYLVLLLCISKIIDLAAGLNSHILSMSSHFKILLLFLSGSALINVGLNYLLIPPHGLMGCGIATVTSILFFNICKFLYLKSKFEITPFTIKTWYILILAFICYLVVFFLPRTSNSYINLMLFSGLFASMFMTIVYVLKLSPEVNKIIDINLLKLLKLIK